MKFRVLIGAILACVFFSSTAMAADEVWDGRFYVTPFLTYNVVDDDLGVEDDAGFHVAFGKRIARHFNIEFQAMDWSAEDSGIEADQQGIGLSLMLFPNADNYGFYGLLGAMDSEVELANSTTSVDIEGIFYDIGLGYLQKLNDHGTSLRWEYRYRRNDAEISNTNTDIELDDHVFMLGLQIPLGAKPMPEPEPVEPPPPPPPPAPAPEPEPEPEPEQLVVLEGVHFEFDSAVLTAPATSILDNAVEAMNTRTDIEAIVVGHTCNLGPATYNEMLSHKRAKSVRDYLISKGISGDRIMSRGYGENHPVASNDTKEGRMQNRRVEVTVIDDRLCLPPLDGDQTDANGCAVLK